MTATAERGTLRGLSAPAPIEDADTEPGSRATLPGSEQFSSGERVRSGPVSSEDEPPVCEPGQRFGDVVITRLVTRGGMGEVYEAFHQHMDQRLALKVLRPRFRNRPEFVERFRDEGKLLAAFCQKEPNVVQIRNVGFDERCGPYITMEWLVGKNFRELQAAWGGPVPLGQAVALMITVADVTHRVHRLGLIHRDLKPENLFLERAPRDVPDAEPRLVLLDLGIAKRAGGERTTDENRTLGTIEYMAPEQIQSGTATARSDQYAIGHMLYEMLRGEHAFSTQMRAAVADGGEERRQLVVMAAHLFNDTPPLDRDLAPTVHMPDGSTISLAAIAQRAMRRDPAERYPSMEAFATDLRAWLAAYRGGGVRAQAAAGVTNGGRLDAMPSNASQAGPSPHEHTGLASAPTTASPSPGDASRGKQQRTLAPTSLRTGAKEGAIESVAQTDFVAAYSLVVVSKTGEATARFPLLRAVVVVGRGIEEADIVLADPTVSRVHCELRHVSPGVFQVVDMGSTHGVLLRGMPAQSGLLRTNDRLTLGHVDLRLCPPGCFRRLANGGWTFVPSLIELPPEDRATVRMVGNAATPQGPILDAERVLARAMPRTVVDSAGGAGPRRAVGPQGPLSRASTGGTSVLRVALYVFALTLLVGVGALAVLRLTGVFPAPKADVPAPARSE